MHWTKRKTAVVIFLGGYSLEGVAEMMEMTPEDVEQAIRDWGPRVARERELAERKRRRAAVRAKR